MARGEDLIGRRFGMLVVLSEASSAPSGHRKWVCRCDCGSIREVLATNLKRGTTVSCGCKKKTDLTGCRIGNLVILERSEKFGTRGDRRTRLWKCRCDCGNTVYRATDTLTGNGLAMCSQCASLCNTEKARMQAGYTEGTQLAKIRITTPESDNASGIRGIYLDRKTGKYRARLVFQQKTYNLGTFTSLEAALKARQEAEDKIFGRFLENQESDV